MLRIPPTLFLPAIIAAALALRCFFFTGFFGSDEVTYTEYALAIARGSWESSDYIGAVRLGISLPVAFSIWLFGNTEFTANLWSLLCSLGEIALVYWLAKHFWGERAAVLSSLVLAFTPLHAHYAGRLMADAPLAFFISLSFFAVFWGQRNTNRTWYVLAGLAAGTVWWIKSAVALVYVPVFALFLIQERKLDSKWLLMALAFFAVTILNGLLFLAMEGDFWKIYRMTTSGVSEYAQKEVMQTNPAYYLKLLFFDIKHTWLLGPLAAAGLAMRPRQGRQDEGWLNTALWAIGLLTVFSFFVVSFKPIAFIPKQVNYATGFLAPLALLAGYALSRLGRSTAMMAATLVVFIGILGTALEQQAIQSFVANSKAAQEFADKHSPQPVYGPTSSQRISHYTKLFANSPEKVAQIGDIQQLARTSATIRPVVDAAGFVAYAIFDRETANWGARGVYSDQDKLPQCWALLGQLEPQGMGLGAQVVRALASAVSSLPLGPAGLLSSRLDALVRPQPAFVYGIGPNC